MKRIISDIKETIVDIKETIVIVLWGLYIFALSSPVFNVRIVCDLSTELIVKGYRSWMGWQILLLGFFNPIHYGIAFILTKCNIKTILITIMILICLYIMEIIQSFVANPLFIETMQCLAWVANPLFYVASFAFAKGNFKKALGNSLIAFLFALSSFTIKELPGWESVHIVESFGIGFYLWFGALISLLLASILSAIIFIKIEENPE